MKFTTEEQQISTVFESSTFHTESHVTHSQVFSTLATALRLDCMFRGILYRTWRIQTQRKSAVFVVVFELQSVTAVVFSYLLHTLIIRLHCQPLPCARSWQEMLLTLYQGMGIAM